MLSPLEHSPVPDDLLDQVPALARDLAYGASLGLWETRLSRHALRSSAEYAPLRDKWPNPPSLNLLLSFGYLLRDGSEAQGAIPMYLLAEKAFELLRQPSSPPSIFISYKRSESSALGLLLEARLKLAGNLNPFIDKNLVPGQDWSAHLERQVRQSRYVILLVGPSTLASPHVQQELAWAQDSGAILISVWHNGARLDESAPLALQRRHAVRVVEENALSYESAVNQVLNSLGYATY